MVRSKTAVKERRITARVPEQERGADTVAAIRAAGTRLLLDRDYARVSVAELARAARVGVGTFYHFYPTKEALILDLRQSLIAAGMEALLAGFTGTITGPTSFQRELARLLERWLELALEHRGLLRAAAALSFGSAVFARELALQEEVVVQSLQLLLRTYAQVLRPALPEEAARTVVLLVEAAVHRVIRDEEPTPETGPLAREVARMIARYLLPAAHSK